MAPSATLGAGRQAAVATAHLLFGPVGAGKTTLARRLESEHGAVRFTLDEWTARLFGEDPPESCLRAGEAALLSSMEPIWTRCLERGVDVVLDFGFWRRSDRDRVRALVAAAGARSRLHASSCPPEVAWRRVEARNRSSSRSLIISRATFEVLLGRLEPLDADEDRMEVDGAVALL